MWVKITHFKIGTKVEKKIQHETKWFIKSIFQMHMNTVRPWI